jgi:microcystin-dependent protein
LFGVTSTAYGAGDGSTTFNLPDMRGRHPVGLDSSNAAFDSLSDAGGVSSVTLAEANLPAHAHTINHDHGSVSSGSGSAHSHGVTDPGHAHTQIVLANNLSGFTVGFDFSSVTTTLTNLSSYTGANTVGQTTGVTVNNESAHTHPVDLPNFTGTSGNGSGTATAFSVVNPYRVVNYIIKF